MKFQTKFNGVFIDRPSNINDVILKRGGYRSYIDILYQPVRGRLVPDEVWNNVYTYAQSINHRNTVILPNIHAIDKDQDNRIGQVPTTAYANAKGGVKKKFFPTQGVVVAGDAKTAKGDYKREDEVFDRLSGTDEDQFEYASFQKKMGDDPSNDINLKAFLKTNMRDSKANSVKLDQMRRVSIYGSFNDFNNRQGNEGRQYHTTLERFVNDFNSTDPDKPNQHPTVSELISCVHQLIKIHEYLYINIITHGDMHMGNIKIIRNDSGVLLKTFDFGKADTKNKSTFFGRAERNPSRADLRYLIDKTAVSGIHESIWRNKWRGEDHPDQAKHYPLHKLCHLISAHFIEAWRSDTKSVVESRISRYGNQLLDNLGLIRSDKTLTPSERESAVRGMFSVFSNQIVTGALYGDPFPFNE